MEPEMETVVVLPPEEFDKLLEMIENPPEPSERMREAARRFCSCNSDQGDISDEFSNQGSS